MVRFIHLLHSISHRYSCFFHGKMWKKKLLFLNRLFGKDGWEFMENCTCKEGKTKTVFYLCLLSVCFAVLSLFSLCGNKRENGFAAGSSLWKGTAPGFSSCDLVGLERPFQCHNRIPVVPVMKSRRFPA